MDILGSTIGQIFQPLYEALAYTMAFFYALIPNFAVAIALLTVAVMAVTAPLTVKSTRSTIAMQRLAPEMKKLQQKYKGDKATLNEEMMRLYKEHNINPAGGCLPMLIQLPVFVVLYGVIRGLTNTITVRGKIIAKPRYISSHTHLYKDLIAAHGHMKAFGLDLADTLFTHHTPAGYIPYGAIIAVAIGLQYFQMRQLNSRNPAAAQANPQMQMMQRYMPLIFAVIYIRIAAGVNIYFVISSLCRIGIQEAIFRSGILDKPQARREGVLPARGGGAAPRRTLMERLADAQQRALDQQKARQAGLQADMDTARREAPKRPAGGTAKPASSGPKELGPGAAERPTGNGKASSPGGSTSGASDKAGGSETSAARAPKSGDRPGGTPRRPPPSGTKSNGSGTNGRAGQSGGSNGKAAGNGASPATPPGQGHPRSARKRPRKAR
ncbi:MAG: membrane protein insertase YidC [Acidimicrobiales bacterium]|jgi:YidC/Oxa1 family membrane protein insertase